MADLSTINNLQQLRVAKEIAEKDIESARNRLEARFTNLPGRLLGGALGMVAGAVAQGFRGAGQTAQQTENMPQEPVTFTDTLKSVGEETAYFALAKLVEKLLTQR